MRLIKRRDGKRLKLGAVLRAALVEPRRIEVTNQPIIIPKLPAEFHGFRILQLSDIHHSAYLSKAEIMQAVRCANDLNPDLIVLTGDYISYTRSLIPGAAEALGRLQCKEGVFAILGNHDHWTDG